MKILIGTDGSDYSRSAIEKFCDLAVDHETTEINVVSVYHSHTPPGTFSLSALYFKYFEAVKRQLYKRAESYVSEGIALIKSRFPESKIKLSGEIRTGVIAKTLVESARTWHADLIVVGSHGRDFWKRATVGSVSNSVIHYAACSVLIVRKKVLVKSQK